jgi:hypothetical protein
MRNEQVALASESEAELQTIIGAPLIARGRGNATHATFQFEIHFLR